MGRRKIERDGKCSFCGEAAEDPTPNKYSGKVSCVACTRKTLRAFFDLKDEERRLLDAGVHPRIAERRLTVKIQKGALDPRKARRS